MCYIFGGTGCPKKYKIVKNSFKVALTEDSSLSKSKNTDTKQKNTDYDFK